MNAKVKARCPITESHGRLKLRCEEVKIEGLNCYSAF